MSEQFELDRFLPYRISSLAEKVSGSLAGVYSRRFQVTVAQWRVMATLQAFPGMAAKTVAQRCNLDKVKVSRAVGDLERRGLLQRRPSASDGRASELRLTGAGLELFERIAPLALDWEQSLLATLTGRERTALLATLTKLESRVPAPGASRQTIGERD